VRVSAKDSAYHGSASIRPAAGPTIRTSKPPKPDQQKRKALVWDIDKKPQENAARPIIYHNRGGTCWQPQLNGLILMGRPHL
jgi:hypothetical protein